METFKKHGLLNYPGIINIVSDQGSENKGDVLKWIEGMDNKDMVIKKTVGKAGFIYYNNEVESCFHTFKNEFSAGKTYLDVLDLKNGLDNYEIYLNCTRYPKDLYGLLPQQVLNGELPDKTKFKERILAEKKLRYTKNKAAKFCDVCSTM